MISEVDIQDWGTSPTKPIEDQNQYEHYLKNHDWLYQFSDDHSVWRRGARGHAYLMEASLRLDPHKYLWNLYAPSR